MRGLRRLRIILPPIEYLAIVAGVNIAFGLVMTTTVGVNPNNPQATEAVAGTMIFLHLLSILPYGVFRVAAFHPFCRPNYRTWLETTPWNHRKPLPIGPVHPVWQDAIPLVAVGSPLWYFGWLDPLASLSLTLGVYLLFLSSTFRKTGAAGFDTALLFTLGLAVLFWRERPAIYSGIILVALMIGMLGLNRSLKRWPWADTAKLDIVKIENGQIRLTANRNDLGWPYDRLGPRTDPPSGPKDYVFGVLDSLVFGWFAFVSACAMPMKPGGNPVAAVLIVWGGLFYIGLAMAGARLSTFIVGYESPLKFLGRLARFRWIIPSYDQVLVAPIVIFVTLSSGPYVLMRAGVPGAIAVGISAALMMLAFRLGGPDRRTWQLTAKHRIVPAMSAAVAKQGGFVQVG